MNLLRFSTVPLLLVSAVMASAEPTKDYRLAKSINPKQLRVREFSINDKAAAERLLGARKDLIESLFQPESDPYLGKTAKPKPCRLENLAEAKEQLSSDSFRYTRNLYASKAKVLGDCKDMKEAYRVRYEFLYCSEKKKAFTLTYFYTNSKKWLSSPLASCD